MRISKPRERWFVIDGDPDGARLKIKHLTPGERSDIIEKTFSQDIEYQKDEFGELIPKITQAVDRRKDIEETMLKSVVDWESFYDENGEVMECNPANIIKAVREIEGFTEWVADFRKQIEKDVVVEEKELEKN